MNTDELIGKLKNYFKIVFYEEFDYIRTGEYEFVISLDEEEQHFSIYREFSFPVHSNIEESSEIMFFELQFIQSLYSVCHMEPEMEYELAMGCCYDDELVGFFTVELSNEAILEYVKWFIDAENCEGTLDYDFLREVFPDRLESYINQWNIENNKLEKFLNSGWRIHKYKELDSLHRIIHAIVNDNGSVIAGIDEEGYKEIANYLKIDTYDSVSLYVGLDYAMVNKGDSCVVWDVKLVSEVIEQIKKMELYYEGDISYYLSNRNTLLVKCVQYWAIIMPIKSELDKIVMSERKKLKSMWDELYAIYPDVCSEEMEDIDISKICPSDFEALCKHILGELGFENILSRGNTNSSDGGVDIECDEEVKRIFGVKTKHWIFQCKHTKKQMDRKDVAEISCLLREFNAEGYGLFYSGTFTPQTIDRLKMMSDDKCDIYYWDKFMIARTISKNTNLKRIYMSMVEKE